MIPIDAGSVFLYCLVTIHSHFTYIHRHAYVHSLCSASWQKAYARDFTVAIATAYFMYVKWLLPVNIRYSVGFACKQSIRLNIRYWLWIVTLSFQMLHRVLFHIVQVLRKRHIFALIRTSFFFAYIRIGFMFTYCFYYSFLWTAFPLAI